MTSLKCVAVDPPPLPHDNVSDSFELMDGTDQLSTVSVIVSTYTKIRVDEVLACLHSLFDQTLKPKEILLILDPDEDLKSFYAGVVPHDVSIISSQAHGLSNARNTGVRNCTGDIVAFIDDDAVAEKDWLRRLVKNYEDQNVLSVGGLVVPVWENGRPRWFPQELDWIVGCSYKGLPNEKSIVRNPIGCNMSFRSEVFKKIGYFETGIGRSGRRLFASEETEFSIRLLRRFPNSKIVYDPSAIVHHKVTLDRQRITYFIRRSFFEGFSKRLLAKTIPDTTEQLSVENRYLTYLVGVGMLSRLKRIFALTNLLQALALGLSISVVLLGYFWGAVITGFTDESQDAVSRTQS